MRFLVLCIVRFRQNTQSRLVIIEWQYMDESGLDLFYKSLFLQYRQSQLDFLLFVFPLFVFVATNHHSTVENGILGISFKTKNKIKEFLSN
jgi:hypothetical protein